MENNSAEVLLQDRRQARQRDSAPDIRQYRGVYWTRLILRIASLGTCIAIAVFLIDALRSYSNTKHVTNPFRSGSGQFPVWPEDLKLWPTHILLGAAIVAGILGLLLVVASFTKSVRRMTPTGNVTTFLVSSSCLVVWVVVTAYYGSWDSKETQWDLMSWTCTHQDPSFDYKNIDFSEFCAEMRFAFWAGVGLAGLEALNLSIFVGWWLKTRRARGYKKMAEGKDSNPASWIPRADVSGFFS